MVAVVLECVEYTKENKRKKKNWGGSETNKVMGISQN